MKSEQISGKVDQQIGKLKQAVGEATHNDDLANRGLAQQAKGAAKEVWGNAREAASEAASTLQAEHAQQKEVARKRVSNAVQNVKEGVNHALDSIKQDQREKRQSA